MKATNYLAKYYDVEVTPVYDHGHYVGDNIEIYEKGEDSEPIGFFVTYPCMDVFQWNNIYGKVETGTAFTEAELKAAAKQGLFYS